ncbi:MAG: Bax inhibitor-1/YccA family protein [Anaerotruncus sp.]|nr:Bax inhibitor-1/YccA family protein [Anaerotruncus sp.]
MYTNGNADLSYSEQQARNPLYKHVAATFGWMFLGLLLTFVTAFGICMSPALLFLFFSSTWSPFVLLIAQLFLVGFLSARIQHFSVGTARGIFLAYSVLSGASLTPILLLYDLTSVIFCFLVAALFFGIMAVAGLVTKRDVARFAPIVLIGLVTMLIMQLISMFLNLPQFDTIISFVGIALFMGITTYDAKRTKDFYYSFQHDEAMLHKVSIFSALELYLDFLNLFLYLIRLLGRKK